VAKTSRGIIGLSDRGPAARYDGSHHPPGICGVQGREKAVDSNFGVTGERAGIRKPNFGRIASRPTHRKTSAFGRRPGRCKTGRDKSGDSSPFTNHQQNGLAVHEPSWGLESGLRRFFLTDVGKRLKMCFSGAATRCYFRSSSEQTWQGTRSGRSGICGGEGPMKPNRCAATGRKREFARIWLR